MTREQAEQGRAMYLAALREAGYSPAEWRTGIKEIGTRWHFLIGFDPTVPEEAKYKACRLVALSQGRPYACFKCWASMSESKIDSCLGGDCPS